jgi:3-phosphoinositide dependent protein kinase-1
MESTLEYWVGSTIGEGSYGKVVYAIHKKTNKDVAIKVVLTRQMQTDPYFVKDIRKERDLLITLKSEFVVPLWAAFYDSECIYFVLECLTGGDLNHVIQCALLLQQQEEDCATGSLLRRRDQWHLAIPHYALQLLSALEFIHSNNVVHADLKPHNVLVSDRGKLKLADFGSAIQVQITDTQQQQQQAQQQQEQVHPDTAIALRGMGTADYACPEVIRGATSSSSYDALGIDLWSFGCVLFAMWEGTSPFHDESGAALAVIQRVVEHHRHPDQPLPFTRRIPLCWQELIRDFLMPEAHCRLGMVDLEDRNGSKNVTYTSIRRRSCLLINDAGDGSAELPFLASEPSWWTNAKNETLRDGAVGWSAFLLS